MYKIISLCLVLSAFPTRKDFVSYQTKKWLLPLISCFSPASAASNYWLPPAGPHLVMLTLVPVSKIARQVTWA